jgi:hypothetical protein
MNWKIFGRKQPWRNFKEPSQHLSGETEENHEKPQSGYPDSGQDLNLGLPKYKAGVLIT